MITENTAKYAGGEYMKVSFADVLKPKPVDNRTGEEIVFDLAKRMEIEVI